MIYLLFTIALACNELNVICRTTCYHDGDQKGIVIDGKCYCANYRNLDDVIVKVPKNGAMVKTEQKKSLFWD